MEIWWDEVGGIVNEEGEWFIWVGMVFFLFYFNKFLLVIFRGWVLKFVILLIIWIVLVKFVVWNLIVL